MQIFAQIFYVNIPAPIPISLALDLQHDLISAFNHSSVDPWVSKIGFPHIP